MKVLVSALFSNLSFIALDLHQCLLQIGMQGTTDGRRIWGTRGDAASDGAVEGRYGRYAEGGGCAGHAAIAISRCGAAAARRPVRRVLFHPINSP